MEKNQRDLVQQLFATALARLEDATEIAAAAQVSSMSRAERLQQAAQAIGMLAATAGIVAQSSPKKTRSS